VRNVLVLGSGRSGTSAVAACFRNSGAYLGSDLIPSGSANPTGYYEDYGVNRLNNLLIHRILYPAHTFRLLHRLRIPAHRDWRAYWLAAPRRTRAVRPTRAARLEMRRFLAKQPYVLKDPRFSVTLPSWRLLMETEARYLAVFRDPMKTADSILRHAEENYSPPLDVDLSWALTSWLRTYRRVLGWSERWGEWLFLDAADVLAGRATDTLNSFAETELDFSHIDPRVSRSRPASIDRSLAGLAAKCRMQYELLITKSVCPGKWRTS
jgi:hypothetical protein